MEALQYTVEKNIGSRMDPCGTPVDNFLADDVQFCIQTH